MGLGLFAIKIRQFVPFARKSQNLGLDSAILKKSKGV